MPVKPALNELCLLCRQIFKGKWTERTLSPDKPTELGFGSNVIRSGYYGLRPYTDIFFDPSTGLWQADDSLQQSNEEADAELARSTHEFRSQSLESDPDSPNSSPRFFPGEEPDLLRRYKAAFVYFVDGMFDRESAYVTEGGLDVILKEEEFEQGIQVANLPLTFQHAIDFARLLKCQYLWIDALCIIQDSQEDWLEESRTMSSIYSNSWLNLAATSSRDGSGGLYHPRNLALSNPLNVQYSDREYTVTDLSAWQRRIEDSPLNHRAWVQQERFLAPRVVHFSYDQIWWQCVEERASETYPSGLPHYLNSKDNEDLLSPSSSPYDTDADVLHPRWLRWVEGYSKTDITKDSERLVATAGIASSFMNLLIPQHSVYLAGIMSEHLVISLLWHGTGTPIKLGSSVAPSWSWASVKGGVKFDCGNLEITHPILAPSSYTDSVREDGYPTAMPYEAERRMRPRIASDHFAMAVLQYYDPYLHGIIDPSRGDFIRMHAPLYRIKLTSPGHSQLDNRLQFQQIQVGAHESWPGLDTSYLDDESWYHDAGWNSRKTYFCRFLPKLYPPPEIEAEPDGHNNPDGLDRLKPTGLILEPTGKQRGQYQRIGWLSMNVGDTWSKLEEHEFLEDMGDGTYVIDLV
ncbi:MAG: hypothetical protein Q9198_003439 [Flavoplaca austrocitrina]